MGSDQIELSVINTSKVMSSSRQKFAFERNVFNFVLSGPVSLQKLKTFQRELIVSPVMSSWYTSATFLEANERSILNQ